MWKWPKQCDLGGGWVVVLKALCSECFALLWVRTIVLLAALLVGAVAPGAVMGVKLMPRRKSWSLLDWPRLLTAVWEGLLSDRCFGVGWCGDLYKKRTMLCC